MSIPISTGDAVLNYSGFVAEDAIAYGLTDEKILGYFTPENFSAMFSDDDISDWPCTWSEMAEYAINEVNELKGQQAHIAPPAPATAPGPGGGHHHTIRRTPCETSSTT